MKRDNQPSEHEASKQATQSAPAAALLDEIAIHISNSKAFKFYIETGKHLRDSIKTDYRRTARKDLEALLLQSNKELIEKIEGSIPEKKLYKLVEHNGFVSPTNETFDGTMDGFNQALSEVTTILKQAKEEL